MICLCGACDVNLSLLIDCSALRRARKMGDHTTAAVATHGDGYPIGPVHFGTCPFARAVLPN